MKSQKILSSFFKQRRMAVESEKHEDGLDKDGAAGEVSSISQPPELQESLASSSTSMKTYNDCPHRDFAQKAKSRGGSLVACMYIKETTYSRKYARKNLNLLGQGLHGIIG